MQIGCKLAKKKRACNVYVFQLSLRFALHNWWLGTLPSVYLTFLKVVVVGGVERRRRRSSPPPPPLSLSHISHENSDDIDDARSGESKFSGQDMNFHSQFCFPVSFFWGFFFLPCMPWKKMGRGGGRCFLAEFEHLQNVDKHLYCSFHLFAFFWQMQHLPNMYFLPPVISTPLIQ